MKKHSNHKKAGEFVRKMSLQRRQKAMGSYGIGLGLLVGVPLIFLLFKASALGFLLAVAGAVGAYYYWKKGENLMRSSERAFRGAEAEREVAAILEVLTSKNWQIEYNLRVKRWGDVDAVLCSPKGNWYAIDVKSHRGIIVRDNNQLKRARGREVYDFYEGDLLAKVRGQAAEVARLKQVKWVVPLLCFTRAKVGISKNNINGVHVVDKNNLIPTLETLEG